MNFHRGPGIERRQFDRRSLPPQSPQRFIQPIRVSQVAKLESPRKLPRLNGILRLAVVLGDGTGDAVETPVVPPMMTRKTPELRSRANWTSPNIPERVQVAKSARRS